MSEKARASAESRPLRGDEAALFECHAARLTRVVRGSVNAPPHIVDEACSFAWFQLVRTQPERDAVFAWLRVVATREAIRLWRRASRDDSLDRALEAPGSGGAGAVGEPRSLAGNADVARELELREALELIARLPERRRRIFALHLSGLTYDEISARTGEGARAIDRQIRKARVRLRRVLGESSGQQPGD